MYLFSIFGRFKINKKIYTSRTMQLNVPLMNTNVQTKLLSFARDAKIVDRNS